MAKGKGNQKRDKRGRWAAVGRAAKEFAKSSARIAGGTLAGAAAGIVVGKVAAHLGRKAGSRAFDQHMKDKGWDKNWGAGDRPARGGGRAHFANKSNWREAVKRHMRSKA